MVLAFYVLAEDRPSRFHSDRHFDHCLCRRVVRMAKATTTLNDYLSVLGIKYLAMTIRKALGVFAMSASLKIIEQIETERTFNETRIGKI